jgi:hypothetical protein
VQPNYEVAVEFLRRIYPSGPWLLCGISTNRTRTASELFTPDQVDKAHHWLEYHGRELNLFYTVNEAIPGFRQRPSKEKIHRVHFLHVDVDLRNDETPEEGHARILASLLAYKHRPSEIIFSGGGCNALWRLSAPIDVAAGSSGDEETILRAEDIERRNMMLSADLEGDTTHDVGRVLRLPGTINRLNQAKIERGRVPGLAESLHSSDVVYDYSTFQAVAHVPRNASSGGRARGRARGKITLTEDLASLSIDPNLKVLIAQGHHRDPTTNVIRDPNGKIYESRSEVLFYACCWMVREGLTDDVILGIITDARYGISESVIERGESRGDREMKRYAEHCVESARDAFDKDDGHPVLADMNREFAAVLELGKNFMIMIIRGERVLSKYDDEERYLPIFQSTENFAKRVANWPRIVRAAGEKAKSVPAFKFWMESRRRREYQGVVFEPNREVPNYYNLWQGFAAEARPGVAHQEYLDHLLENICTGSREYYDYLIRWMARVVQQPATRSMVAVVVLGGKGVGKSVFAHVFAELFGPHAYTAASDHEVTGKFNAHLRARVLLVSEEAYHPNDKRHESVLKQQITGDWLNIESKGLNIVTMPNYLHMILLSNEEEVIPATGQERRWFVLRTQNKSDLIARGWDDARFLRLVRGTNREMLSNLLHHLMSVDLSDFDVVRYPETQALRDQQLGAMEPEPEWLLSKLEMGVWLEGRERWTGPVVKELLYQDYIRVMDQQGRQRRKSPQKFTRWLGKEFPGTRSQQLAPQKNQHVAQRPVAFVFPPLEECRRVFAIKHHMVNYPWPEVGEDVLFERDAFS